MPRFTSFVVFAEMRTGSNLLEANLNTLPGVVSHGEVFNRYILGKKDRTELFGITMEERDRDPRPLLAKLRENTEGLPGFRFFHDHDLRILDDVLPEVVARRRFSAASAPGWAATTGSASAAGACGSRFLKVTGASIQVVVK